MYSTWMFELWKMAFIIQTDDDNVLILALVHQLEQMICMRHFPEQFSKPSRILVHGSDVDNSGRWVQSQPSRTVSQITSIDFGG